MKTAQYQTERGAKRYRDELARAFAHKPELTFSVRTHPFSFHYAVAVYRRTGHDTAQLVAWAGVRPRGGPKAPKE